MTSAPRSPSSIVQNGPARTVEQSTTRRPASAPAGSVDGVAGSVDIRAILPATYAVGHDPAPLGASAAVGHSPGHRSADRRADRDRSTNWAASQIGRASCRKSVDLEGGSKIRNITENIHNIPISRVTTT